MKTGRAEGARPSRSCGSTAAVLPVYTFCTNTHGRDMIHAKSSCAFRGLFSIAIIMSSRKGTLCRPKIVHEIIAPTFSGRSCSIQHTANNAKMLENISGPLFNRTAGNSSHDFLLLVILPVSHGAVHKPMKFVLPQKNKHKAQNKE